MRRSGLTLATLLLLGPSLVGCLGLEDGTDGAALTGATGWSDERRLPQGLEMDGAEVVSYNETSVTWRWTGSADPGFQPVPVTTVAAFDVPADLPFAVEGNLTWSDGDSRAMRIAVHDADGAKLCQGIPYFGPGGPKRVSCASFHPAAEPGARSSVEVQTYLAEAPTPFELTLRLTLGDGDTIPTRPMDGDGSGVDEAAGRAHTVIGFGDTGINPYHRAYRDDAPEAYLHPSTYIDGYPEDAVALSLSLDAASYADAVGADAELWASLEHGQLYWIPGTKIIGAYAPDGPRSYEQSFCQPVLDCDGHGSGMAARAVGEAYSLCEECKLVEVQGYQTGLEWMAEQPWIDISVLEYCYYPVREGRIGDRAEDDELFAAKPTFVTGGNGLGNTFGAGVPYYPCHHEGLPNAITVGGHNDGRVTAWTNPLPAIVADACAHVPRLDSKSDDFFGCGESLTAPYAAGAAGAILQAAREILGDHVGGAREGVLAKGAPGTVLEGPLADGDLTIEELKRVLFTTADPRPGRGEHGGPYCEPTEPDAVCQITTTPIEWRWVPDGVPQYYLIGYGAVTPDTLEHAKTVLRGEVAMPERPVEDAFFALDQEVREALVDTDPETASWGDAGLHAGSQGRTYLASQE